MAARTQALTTNAANFPTSIATEILGRTWETLEDTIPPAWYPHLKGVKAVSSTRISGQLHEYGCGGYGCVFPTHDPGIVIKVTTDDTEAEFAANLSPTLVAPICVRYERAVKLDINYEGRQVFMLWRESAHRVGQIGDVLGPQALDMILVQHAAAQKAYLVMEKITLGMIDADPKVVLPPLIADWLKACEVMARQTSVPPLRRFGNGLVEVYSRQRIFFGDIHAGNVGIVHRADGGHWVITDPGHVSVVDFDL